MDKTWEHRKSISLKAILLLFAVTVGMAPVESMLVQFPSARAQERIPPCNPPAYAPTRTIQLVPKIPPLSSQTAVGVFVSQTISVLLGGNEYVCLASSPDGFGKLQVDDQLDLHVTRADGTKREWTHDFQDPATGIILPDLPRDVSTLFVLGQNNVLLFLTDLRPDRHSAEPVWLVIWASSAQVGVYTPRPTITPMPTAGLIGPGVTSTVTVVPTQITQPSPTPTQSNTNNGTPSWWRELGRRLASVLEMIEKNGWGPSLFIVVVAVLIVGTVLALTVLKLYRVPLGYFLARVLQVNQAESKR